MKRSDAKNMFVCPREEIGAFLDGELSADQEAVFETHIASCPDCREELNLQRSFLIALNGSLEENADIQIPKDFTRNIISRAESDLSGIRSRSERVVALSIAGILILMAAAALGGEFSSVIRPARAAIEKLSGLCEVVGHISYRFVFGTMAVLRSALSRQEIGLSIAAVLFTVVASIGVVVAVAVAIRRHTKGIV